MPQLQAKTEWEQILFNKVSKKPSAYMVLSPKGLGTVRFSDPYINGKVPVIFTDGSKFLVNEKDLEIVTVVK